jgi:hypothetical protein
MPIVTQKSKSGRLIRDVTHRKITTEKAPQCHLSAICFLYLRSPERWVFCDRQQTFTSAALFYLRA